MKHLRAEEATPAGVYRLSAWVASACGDTESERRELAALTAMAPEDFQALERLETLEQRGGEKSVVAELRIRRTEIERTQVRYRELYRRGISRRAMPRRWRTWPIGWGIDWKQWSSLTPRWPTSRTAATCGKPSIDSGGQTQSQEMQSEAYSTGFGLIAAACEYNRYRVESSS